MVPEVGWNLKDGAVRRESVCVEAKARTKSGQRQGRKLGWAETNLWGSSFGFKVVGQVGRG